MNGTHLVCVDRLTIGTAGQRIVDNISFAVPAGAAVGLVGESGSGKTTVALAILGHVRDGMRHVGGRVLVRDEPVLPTPPAWLRGRTVGYVAQDPGQALNPYRRIGAELLTSSGVDRRVPRAKRAAVIARLLARVGLPGDRAFARRFPHQLSGGQQQRVALALALSREPALLILDEPTTGLDVVTKAEVLAELRRIQQTGVTTLWVSHDLAMLDGVVDRLLVLDKGHLVEDAPLAGALGRPASATATKLLAAVPRMAATVPGSAAAGGTAPVLAAHGLVAGYDRSDPVLRGVDLAVAPGECLAVLGASGVGKSTLARCLVGLHRPRAGQMLLGGVLVPADVRHRSRVQLARIQLVAQDPAEALHPRQTVRTAIGRPLTVFRGLRGSAREAEIQSLLAAMKLAERHADRLPAELSGGERQRVAIARALAARPQVLICDEVTSALDLVTQSAVLALLDELRQTFGLAVVLITHDPAVAVSMADRLIVLADGLVAEEGTPAAVLEAPATEIGRKLRDAVPSTVLDTSWGKDGDSPLAAR